MFAMKSPAHIVKDNQVVQSFSIGLDELDVIKAFCEEEDIIEIILYGPTAVLEKYKEVINTQFTQTPVAVKIVD
jgi:hypothetical protein